MAALPGPEQPGLLPPHGRHPPRLRTAGVHNQASTFVAFVSCFQWQRPSVFYGMSDQVQGHAERGGHGAGDIAGSGPDGWPKDHHCGMLQVVSLEGAPNSNMWFQTSQSLQPQLQTPL